MSIAAVLCELGFARQVEVAGALNAIDDQLGDGSGNRSAKGKSWGEVTEDDWANDPRMVHVSSGSFEEILFAYAERRRGGLRGWLSVTTLDWLTFHLWRPAGGCAGDRA